VYISRAVFIEFSFRWIPSCLAWCPLIREIAGYEPYWSSTISLRFYCTLLVHFALQWLPMMTSPIAPLLFNITSDMTSSQATTEMYSSYVHCQGCIAGAKVLKRQHRLSSGEQPLARSDAKSPEKATSRCPSCSQVRVSSAWFEMARLSSFKGFAFPFPSQYRVSAVSRASPRLRVSLHLGSFLTGDASPDLVTRQCFTLIYTSNDFRCALSVLQEPFYGLPLSAHVWQLSTDATWPYSCGPITFEC
jgi:hypothetical protein